MPSRKTYEINNREQGKAAQRDQSFRSCLIALLIFFFLCLILILVCIPWKTRNQTEYKDRYVEHEPQHHHGERTKEVTTMTVPSTTQRASTTGRTVLSRTLTTPKTVITSTITESRPIKDIEIISTENYSKKNVKGSRYFERYFNNRTSKDETTSPAPVSPENVEDYVATTNEILKNVGTTEESDGLSTLPRDIVTDDVMIDNDPASTSPSGPIISTATLKNVTTADIIKDVTTSKSVKEAITERHSTDRHYSSDRSEIDTATSNVTSPTLLTRSRDLEENTSENSTDKFERLRIGVVSDNITFSTTPSPPTDLEESTNVIYSSDKNNYSETSQSEVTTSNVSITVVNIRGNITTSTSPTRLDPEEDKDTENSTATYSNYEKSAVTEYNATLIDENVMRENSSATINYILSATKFKNEAEREEMMNETAMNAMSYTTEKYNENVTSGGMEKHSVSSRSNYENAPVTFVFYNHTTSTAVPISHNLTTVIGTTLSDEDTSVCETGHCKQIASRMLSYMNHSADPCDDFYEYACGGFEANPQLMDENLVRRSRNYQRIASQMLKKKHENSTFATYYSSCVQYERSMNLSERTRMASDALRKIGKFYVSTTWLDNHVDFTNIIAQLILHHSALLFDVVPELDEYRPDSFTLRIGPTTYESPFEAGHVEDPCLEDVLETKEQYVDLEILYNDYKKCKNVTSEFGRSIRKALTELDVFKGLNDSRYSEWNVQSEYIEETANVIDSVIIRGYFSHFPPESEIREAYSMNNYSKVSLVELQGSSAFVNWTQLIRSLTGLSIRTDADIQVYFHDALIKGLRRLEEYAKENAMGLNNAIMGLYAHKLYNEFVLPKRDSVKDHCLHAATYLLQLEASSLYISSFTNHETAQMDKMVETVFSGLKRALSMKTLEAQWARVEGQEELLKKIDSLQLALPAVSYFKNRDLLYNEYNVSKVILNDDYFSNSMILLKRYRTLMYIELTRHVGDPKQIWTYFATPFQSKARVIYVLNLIVIPYGVIDWSLINDESFFDYLLLATLGNLIAHQIAHHFDTKGIHYWNQIRDTQYTLMHENESTDMHFDDYINCQKESLYQGSMNMKLPFTDQTVAFRIPLLTLNERLSEIMGLRLAYDTLALTRSDTSRLPWIRLRIDQLFYLAYAQTYCTRTPLTSSYVSLYESEDLPSRIRVFVSASNNKLLAEAWNCPLGSQIAPNDVCSVFPYIDSKETAVIPE